MRQLGNVKSHAQHMRIRTKLVRLSGNCYPAEGTYSGVICTGTEQSSDCARWELVGFPHGSCCPGEKRYHHAEPNNNRVPAQNRPCWRPYADLAAGSGSRRYRLGRVAFGFTGSYGLDELASTLLLLLENKNIRCRMSKATWKNCGWKMSVRCVCPR